MAEEKETYPNHGEKDGNGTKNSFGWCNTRDLLCETQPIDGYIQRGENTVPPLRSLGFGCHGPQGSCEKAARRGGREEENCTRGGSI